MFTNRKQIEAAAYARAISDAANHIEMWGAHNFLQSRQTPAIAQRLTAMAQAAEALALEVRGLAQ